MFKQFRKFERGEFFIVGGDCSQGGEDSNCCQFYSKTKQDVPLHYHKQGVATTMTTEIYPVLNKIFDVTGIPPVVGFERQNGGASEMERLRLMNRYQKYTIFVMPKVGKNDKSLDENTNNKEDLTNDLGYNTSDITRPTLVGDLKNFIDLRAFKVYDETTIQQLFWFILSRTGKPQAMRGKHDDCVMALGITQQIAQIVIPPAPQELVQQKTDQARNVARNIVKQMKGFY